MAMARKLTVAMAVKALLLLAVLALLPCAAVADVHASMPALAAHIREIQRLAKTARGEVEVEVEELDLVGSLGVAEPVGAEDEVPEADAASQLFLHIREMQKRAAEKLESLNGEDETETETEGIMEIVKEEEEKEVEELDLVGSLGVAEPVGAEDEVPEVDAASQLFLHIREMQQRAAEKLESLNGEDETETETEGIMGIVKEEEEKEVEELDLVGSLGVAEPIGAEDEVPEVDAASQLFLHIREMQQRAAQKLENLNGEDETETETEGIMEIAKEEEEKEVDPGGLVDALVQKRFTQLESALKFLNDEDGSEWSADGAQGDDAINFLDQFVRERKQKKRGPEESEPQLENDQSLEAFIERGEIGDRDKHGDRDHGLGYRQHDHDHGDAHVDAGFSGLSDALHNDQDHGDHSHREKHRKSVKKTKFILPDEEKEADTGGVVDALVQERFNQLEAALKVLNYKDSGDSLRWGEDGSEVDDGINLLHHFVQERQQKRHQESHLEKDQIHEATSVEHGHGHRKNHGDREHVGHDHKHGLQHDHGDAHANADFSGVSDAHYRNHDHQHGESFKKKKFILPEEIVEEEDLLQYGFEEQKSPSAEHLSRSRGPELGVWLRAMGCSLLVSLASLICLVLLPCIVSNGKPSETVVNTLTSFGAGAMLGDAFLHQLPHAFGNSETPHSRDVRHHDHSHIHAHGHDHILSAGQGHAHSLQDLSIGLAVLGGIFLFFIVEKIVRRYEELSSNSGQRGRGHNHHRRKKKNEAKKLDTPEKIAGVEELVALANKESSSLDTMSSDLKKRKSGQKKDTASVGNVVSTALAQQVEASGAFVIGYLNLFSDAVHNFTDGMALGSAFLLYGTVGGWSRTLFLLAHELPQEVGDFGILVKSGFSVFEALAFNFLSALVALAGTAVALMLGGSLGHSSLIEGFIAGGFIYMSVGGVMPSMHDQGSSLTSTLSQLVPMVFGVAVAIVISLAE